jgi:EAL domain-containing protein (putative c-di-GMP-specific phosphodiesterase class I)
MSSPEFPLTDGPSTPEAPLPEISFAFQPIVDTRARRVVAFEALVRGPHNQTAASVFEQVSAVDLPRFDQVCRVKAVALVHRLGLGRNLNLNIIPNGAMTPEESIQSTVEAANRANLPLDCVVLEFAEGQVIEDRTRFAEIVQLYRGMGFKLAIDDFGAGYSGLNLLADFQPDQIKLDKELIKDIASRGPRQVIVRALIQVCKDLGIDLVAEGVETNQEFQWLASEGIWLFQGYLFARPGFECFPPVQYEALPQVF